jgi:hypothetical protein
MFRSTALAAVLVFAPVFVSAQEEAVPIGDISVAVELDAVDANALDRWPEIGPDLEAAIRQAAAPYLADNGRNVSVVLNEVSLGGAPVLGESGEFNRLGGWVYVRDDLAQPPILSREIAFQADSFIPGGTTEFVIVPGRPDFYNALVSVFAMRVIEEVEGAD